MIQKEMQLDNTVIYDLSAGECHARGIAVNIPDTELNILQMRRIWLGSLMVEDLPPVP